MNIHSTVSGNGTPIVFLHGWGCDMQMFQLHVSILSQNYLCVNLDLFGFGLTEILQPYHNFKDYVQALHDYLCSIHIYNPIFIAHSFGARIAILYANKHPTKALILTGAAGLKAPLTLKKRFKQTLHKLHFPMKGSYDYEHATPFLRKVLVEVVNTDLSSQLHALQLPVLLIWGENDKETPLWMGKKMNKLITNSTFILFKNEDHFAYYHETHRFCFIVREFIEGIE